MDSQSIVLSNSKFQVHIGPNKNADNSQYAFKLTVLNLKDEVVKALSIPNEGGFYLYRKTSQDDSQSVKLYADKLVIALHSNLICFAIPELNLLWNLDFDGFPIYEFLDIEDDLLLRGELEVFRITEFGKIIWSTFGEDIWVNIEGQREMQLNQGNVELCDFNGKQYIIPIEKTRGQMEP